MANVYRSFRAGFQLIAALAIFGLAIDRPAHGQTNATWLGGSNGSWATTANWSTSAIPGTGTNVIYSGGSNLVGQVLGGSRSVNSFTVGTVSGSVTIASISTSETLTIGNGGVDMSAATGDFTIFNRAALTGTMTLNIASGRTFSLSTPAAVNLNLTGSIGLTGGGTVALAGNSYTYIAANSLVNVGSGATLQILSGNSGATTQVMSVSGTVINNGGLVTNQGGVEFWVGRSGNGAFIQESGTSSFSAGLSIASYDINRTGSVTIKGGTSSMNLTGMAAKSISATNPGTGNQASLSVTGGMLTLTGLSNIATATNSAAFITLSGGTTTLNVAFPTTTLGPGATSTFTLDGGVYRAGASVTILQNLTNAYITNKGAFIDSNGFSTTIAQVLKDGTANGTAGSLTKLNSGTLTLSAANTYSGTTTINQGTLKLGASASFDNSPTIVVGDAGSSGAVLDLTAKTGTFTFGSGQTVKGIGTINIGTGKTVAANGIWAPGNSIGSNAVTGNLSLSGTSQFELGTPGGSQSSPGTADLTAVSGTLSLGGNLSLLDNAGANSQGSYGAGSYRLFTYGALSGSFATVTAANASTRVAMAYGGSGTNAGQGVFANVYNLATSNTLTTVDFGVIHAGGSFASQNLSIVNTAANNGFSEGLNASVSGSSGAGSFGGAGISNLAAGGTSTAISVGLANADTLSAGTKTGALTIGYESNGATTSGFSAVSVGSQTVNLTGQVFSGHGSWNFNGGGSWGSGANANWTSTGGITAAPGTFAGYTNTDSATFGSTLTGGTANISLNGANVSLASLTFVNTAARYVIQTGTGSGSLTFAASSGKPIIDVEGTHEIATRILGSSGLNKTGSGKLILSGSSSYSGNTKVTNGTLSVNGSIAGDVQVDASAILGGSGAVAGVLSGAGLVSPGNSPGILTASQFDPTSGLDAAFEFTSSTPNYSSASDPRNDVLRLTSISPFTSVLTSSNAIDVYFNVDSIASGDSFEGGFFTGLSAGDLLTFVKDATFAFWVKDGAGGRDFNGATYSTLTSLSGITGATLQTATVTRTFATGDVTGSVTQFVIIPEPDTIIFAGIGIAMAGWSLWKRRRISHMLRK